MANDRFRKFILKLNRLRRKKRTVKNKNNFKPEIKKLALNVNSFQLNDACRDILKRHKNFLKIKPISPIFEQSQNLYQTSSDKLIQYILKIHKDFLNLEPLSPFSELTVRNDPRITNIFRKNKDFLNLRPISPISDGSVQLLSSNLKNKSSQSERNNYKACHFHLSHKSSTFCMDCFSIMNSASFSHVKSLEIIASCQDHIFIQPDKFCKNCFWSNYLKH